MKLLPSFNKIYHLNSQLQTMLTFRKLFIYEILVSNGIFYAKKIQLGGSGAMQGANHIGPRIKRASY